MRQYLCDLCGKTEGAGFPDDWLYLRFVNKEEKCLKEKHLCKKCGDDVYAAVKTRQISPSNL